MARNHSFKCCFNRTCSSSVWVKVVESQILYVGILGKCMKCVCSVCGVCALESSSVTSVQEHRYFFNRKVV